MPLPAPPIDGRRYQDLVNEMIERIPAHTPEWTNFNASDPGITLIQLFAHITESLLYRTNQIPERNRAKFLQLLDVKLNPGSAARGLVAFANVQGPLESAIVQSDTELLAGSIPFRTMTSLDVLPVETRLYIKREIAAPSPELQDYYNLLYASYDRPQAAFGGEPSNQPQLYENFEISDGKDVDFGQSVDRCLWVALLGRVQDRSNTQPDPWINVRKALLNRTLSFGIVPQILASGRNLAPRVSVQSGDGVLRFEVPNVNGPVTPEGSDRPTPTFSRLLTRGDFNPLIEPGVVELTLPADKLIETWQDLDPLEAGVGDMPPAIDDPNIADRIVSWIRISVSSATEVKLNWAGINAAQIRQFIQVNAERLGDGDGSPDQVRYLARRPVLPGSVALQSIANNSMRNWAEIDDLFAADPEVAARTGNADQDPLIDVFAVDNEAGKISFGDGLAGARPRDGEALYASYQYSEGIEGNLPAGIIKEGPYVAAGLSATNPVATWGGADPETVAQGEKQIPRVIQHRERLVTVDDFRTIAWRTPGISIGRIEVLPACHPDVRPVAVGTVPGVVTLMAIPAKDPLNPRAPRSDNRFIDALCAYLDPRRLVTTEIALRGASYVGIWLSLGIEVEASFQTAEVVDAVKARIHRYLHPLPPPDVQLPDLLPQLYAPETDPALRGWPLGKPVNARSVLAEAARVPGVISVANVFLARGNEPSTETVEFTGLELPEILGISVVTGDPVPLDDVRGLSAGGREENEGVNTRPRLPVPVFAETC